MKQIIRHTFLLMLFCVLHHSVQAQISESEVKAAYIERFTRFIEWPDDFEDNAFKIAVIGENPFRTSLNNLFTDTKIKNQNVKLIYTNNINDITNVNLVFISGSEKKRINEILKAIGKRPILIISDTKGFCELGTHINMYVDENYIRYEINQETLEKSSLRVTSLLLASAKIVKSND
jgi:hypothetical protein